MRLPVIVLASLASLTACARNDADTTWLGEVVEIPNPAAAGSLYPHLATNTNGTVVMSWLQPVGDGHELRHATLRGSAWSTARTVAAGSDWFVNWADFPSVVPLTDGLWAAHWLQQKPDNVYSYDVRIAVSTDGGEHWFPAMSPHDDGTPTEHGFVSLFDAAGSAGAVWLDGRNTAGGHDHSGGSHGAMTLRSAVIGRDGQRVDDGREIDGRVCDCCQTDVAAGPDGPIVVYRDRSEREVRDIALVRLTPGGWSEPIVVNEDAWTIDACPVNGPAVDADGNTVVVAWFTAPDRPRIRLAFSPDAGRSFSKPIEVASGKVAGRVDVVLLEDGRAVVSWLGDDADGTALRAQPYSREGATAPAVVIARSSASRASGFPRMLAVQDGLLFAWTRAGDSPRVVTAFAPLR